MSDIAFAVYSLVGRASLLSLLRNRVFVSRISDCKGGAKKYKRDGQTHKLKVN